MEKEGERMFLECLDQLEVASAAEVHCIICIVEKLEKAPGLGIRLTQWRPQVVCVHL